MTLFAIAAVVGLAVVVAAVSLRRAARRIDQQIARSRHPVTGPPMLCQCRGKGRETEPWIHTSDTCGPRREFIP